MRRITPSLLLLPILLFLLAPVALAAPPPSPFAGHWEGTDPGDGSNLDVYISGGSQVQILYTDDNATQACDGAASASFTALLTGTVSGTELLSSMRVAKCGNQTRPSLHGLGIGWRFDAGATGSASDDVLTNSFGETYTRAD
jgi:hypothetical protein